MHRIVIAAAISDAAHPKAEPKPGNPAGNTKHSSLKTILVDTKRGVLSLSPSPRSGRQAHKTQQIHDKREREREREAGHGRTEEGAASEVPARLRVLLTRRTQPKLKQAPQTEKEQEKETEMESKPKGWHLNKEIVAQQIARRRV